MNRALIQFRENISRVNELGGIAAAVEAITTQALDCSDIWRAQIVLAVSALDHLVHEMVRIGMIEAASGSRPKTDAYSRFNIPLRAVDDLIAGLPPEQWLGETVRERHGWLSFQNPDKIADAIRHISSSRLWEEVGMLLRRTPQDIRAELQVIVDRRNKIAHEADMDPTNPGFRWVITAQMAADAVNKISMIGEAIFSVVT